MPTRTRHSGDDSVFEDIVSQDTENVNTQFSISTDNEGQFDYTPSSDETAAVAENEERVEMGALETPETKAVDEVVFNMPKKAQNFIKRTEGAIVNRVAKALSVPSSAKRDFLAPVAHRITDEYLKHGSVSDEVTYVYT